MVYRKSKKKIMKEIETNIKKDMTKLQKKMNTNNTKQYTNRPSDNQSMDSKINEVEVASAKVEMEVKNIEFINRKSIY